MKITALQTDLIWEDTTTNLLNFEEKILALPEKTDLIILPEMFNTGFSMAPERTAEPHGGFTFQWMQRMAKESDSILCGSLAVKEDEHYYNRLYWVKSDGSYDQYDKRHLFSMVKEPTHFEVGTKKIIPVVQGIRFCPLICYDLRFPIWSRNRFEKGKAGCDGWTYDVLIYVANWPAVRAYPWKQLLIARAIENQCYVIGVNRIGTDGNGFEHSGDSLIIGPKGEIIQQLPSSEEGLLEYSPDLEALNAFRNQFPVGQDADTFHIE
jgi:predicted amidohydrolase